MEATVFPSRMHLDFDSECNTPWVWLVIQFSSVQSLSCVRLFATPWIAAPQASLSITISRSSLKLTSIESVMPSSHLILCRPLLLLPPIPPSISVFSNESTLHMRWPKYWSFSFSIIPSKEIPGLISFRMDSLDLLAVQGTLKSLLQHHSSKASVLWRSAFFTVQLSHPCMTTGKTIALTRQTFVGKVMSLLLNMLSRLVTTFLPRSKHLLISWLQSPSVVILEPRKIKSDMKKKIVLICMINYTDTLNYVGHLCDYTNLVRMGSFQSWFQHLHLPFCPNLKVGIITDLLVVGCKEVSCCVFFYFLKGHCFDLNLLYKLDLKKLSEQ